MTHTIEVPIPDGLLQLVDQRAQRAGLDRAEYIRVVLSRDVDLHTSLDEILEPFRSEVAASGMTEDELDRLSSQAREDSCRDKLVGQQ